MPFEVGSDIEEKARPDGFVLSAFTPQRVPTAVGKVPSSNLDHFIFPDQRINTIDWGNPTLLNRYLPKLLFAVVHGVRVRVLRWRSDNVAANDGKTV